MKVLLCGGGNAIHVLTSYIGSQPDCETCIFTLCPGEAEKLQTCIGNRDVIAENDLGNGTVHGQPDLVTDDPAKTVESGDIDVVIMAIPSTFHSNYLEALKSYLKPGCVIGAMPGQSGFDLCVRHILGKKFVQESSIFALETLPWACRILEYGRSVQGKVIVSMRRYDIHGYRKLIHIISLRISYIIHPYSTWHKERDRNCS